MKQQKEMYEAPTIQIVDVQMRDFLCLSDTTAVTMYFISQPLVPGAGDGAVFGDTWGWD